MTAQRHAYYFETQADMTAEELSEKLAKAGLRPERTKQTTLMHEGIAFSEELAGTVWTEETYMKDCNGSCKQEGKIHTRWDELDSVQKDLFAESLAGFMNERRAEEFEAEMSLGHREELREVTLQTDLRKRAPGPAEIARRETEREERPALRSACLHRLAAGRKRDTRKGLQRTAYILQEGMGVPTGFYFKNLYGPVSDDLDASVSLLVQMGFLLEAREENGARTETTLTTVDPAGDPLAREMQGDWNRAAAPWTEQITRVLEIFGNRNDQDLNRQASLLMIQHILTGRDENPSPQEILDAAKRVMPKADRAQLQRDLEELGHLGLLRQKPQQGTPGDTGGRQGDAGHDGG